MTLFEGWELNSTGSNRLGKNNGRKAVPQVTNLYSGAQQCNLHSRDITWACNSLNMRRLRQQCLWEESPRPGKKWNSCHRHSSRLSWLQLLSDFQAGLRIRRTLKSCTSTVWSSPSRTKDGMSLIPEKLKTVRHAILSVMNLSPLLPILCSFQPLGHDLNSIVWLAHGWVALSTISMQMLLEHVAADYLTQQCHVDDIRRGKTVGPQASPTSKDLRAGLTSLPPANTNRGDPTRTTITTIIPCLPIHVVITEGSALK